MSTTTAEENSCTWGETSALVTTRRDQSVSAHATATSLRVRRTLGRCPETPLTSTWRSSLPAPERDVPPAPLLADVIGFPADVVRHGGAHGDRFHKAVRFRVSEASAGAPDLDRALIELLHHVISAVTERSQMHWRVLPWFLGDPPEFVEEVVDVPTKGLKPLRRRARERAAQVFVPPPQDTRVEASNLDPPGIGRWGIPTGRRGMRALPQLGARDREGTGH